MGEALLEGLPPSVSSLLSGSGSYSILCDKSVSAPIADFVFYH